MKIAIVVLLCLIHICLAEKCYKQYSHPPSMHILQNVNRVCYNLPVQTNECKSACKRFNTFLEAPKCNSQMKAQLPCRAVCEEYKNRCELDLDCEMYPTTGCTKDKLGLNSNDKSPVQLCSSGICPTPLVPPHIWDKGTWGTQKYQLIGNYFINGTFNKISAFACFNEYFGTATNCSYFDPVEDGCFIVQKFTPTINTVKYCNEFREAIKREPVLYQENTIQSGSGSILLIPFYMVGWQCQDKQGKTIPCSRFTSADQCNAYGFMAFSSSYGNENKITRCQNRYKAWSAANKKDNSDSMSFSLF